MIANFYNSYGVSAILSNEFLLHIPEQFLFLPFYHVSFMISEITAFSGLVFGLLLVAFPYIFSNSTEKFYNIMNIFEDYVRGLFGHGSEPFVFILYFIFGDTLIANLLGLLPFSYATTAQLYTAFYTGFSVFLYSVLLSFTLYRLAAADSFLPAGVPTVLHVPLMLIETASYIARALSISIRLFANLTSGHILMKVFASFSWHLLVTAPVYLSVFIWVFFFLFFILEVFISFLQAYVFTTMFITYLKDAIHVH